MSTAIYREMREHFATGRIENRKCSPCFDEGCTKMDRDRIVWIRVEVFVFLSVRDVDGVFYLFDVDMLMKDAENML